MDFTIYKVKSTKILNKSEDLNGFQDKILRKNTEIIEIVNGLKTIPIKQFSYKFTTPTDLYKYRSLQNNTKLSLDHQIYHNTDLKQLHWSQRSKTNGLPSQQTRYIENNISSQSRLHLWAPVAPRLGLSRSGIPQNKQLVLSWSRIPQELRDTWHLIWLPHLHQC